VNWLNQIVDELVARHPDGEILVESGITPSGKYHLGHMREVLTPDAIMLELRRRGRKARHIHFVDDLDAFRKVPINVPAEYEKYLGMPLCDIPAPDGSDRSYADYFLADMVEACKNLGIDVEFMRAHEKYREGFMVPAIERALERIPEARSALETISGRKLEDTWNPIQILENGRLKNRKYLGIDKTSKVVRYVDGNREEATARYDKGEVKLDWRLDWPARWWLLSIDCEPSGRDHMTKGSSYDTGVQIMKDVYEAEPPYGVAFEFINMAGDTKKMSSSKGTGLDIVEGSLMMPAEVIRYFVFRSPANKQLYFDPINGVTRLMDEFSALSAKADRDESEEQLLYLCTHGQNKNTVSRVPFSHLVASYQASLKDIGKTLDVIKRTEHSQVADEDAEIIKAELRFIDAWLQKRAPEEVKFELLDHVDPGGFSDDEKAFLKSLGDKIAKAPADADGAWFHNAIYEFKDQTGLQPKEMFTVLYRVLIGKTSGPRAGYFLSILPRDWLIARLHLDG
jgi:lysyl-tRNA synthetase, class I